MSDSHRTYTRGDAEYRRLRALAEANGPEWQRAFNAAHRSAFDRPESGAFREWKPPFPGVEDFAARVELPQPPPLAVRKRGGVPPLAELKRAGAVPHDPTTWPRAMREDCVNSVAVNPDTCEIAAVPLPACGHSACRQNWIDTGELGCVEGEAEVALCECGHPHARHGPPRPSGRWCQACSCADFRATAAEPTP
jgi:hypothetical protein